MYCGRCGTFLDAASRFCTKCGDPVASAEPLSLSTDSEVQGPSSSASRDRASRVPKLTRRPVPRSRSLRLPLISTVLVLVLAGTGVGACELHQQGHGNLDCSNLVSAAGYGGSPSWLAITAGGKTQHLHYPEQVNESGSPFGSPVLGIYGFRFEIPAGQNSASVSWVLGCQSADGSSAGSTPGTFAVHGGTTVRDICNHSGIEDPCIRPSPILLANAASLLRRWGREMPSGWQKTWDDASGGS